MAARTVAFSELNPIRFVPLDATYPYNTRHFDADWFRNLLLSWEVKAKYQQKIQRNDDRLYIQVLTNGSTPPELFLYKCDGTASISDKTFTMAVSAYAGYRVWQINISDLISAVADGVYYAVIEVTNTSGVRSWISEPLNVKDYHPGTVSLRFKHRHNKDLVEFEQTGAFFSLRVEAAVIEFEPGVDRVIFEDQDGNPKLLSAVPYRSFQFVAGGAGKNIPDYMVSKLNHVFALSDIWIDGKKFVAADGATLEKQTSDRYPLCAAAIEVREAFNNQGVIYKDGSFIIGEIPGYPWVIESYRLGTITGYFTPDIFSDPIPIISYDLTVTGFAYIPDLTALTAWVALQNSTVIPDAGFTGTLAIDSGNIVFIPGDGDSVSAGDMVVLTEYFTITQTVPAGGGSDLSDTRVQMSGSGAPYVVVTEGAIYLSGYLTGSLSTLRLRGAEDGTRVFNVFHRNIIRQLIISDGADATFPVGTVTGISNLLPESLILFSIFQCRILAAFDFFTMLIRARLSLQQALISENDDLADLQYFHEIGEDSFSALKTINISKNNLNVSAVNSFFNSIYLAIIDSTPFKVHFTVHNGTINIQQLPPAAPTSGSAISRAVLTGSPFNWILITD